MSDLVDRSIAELRAQHDQLAEVVAGLTQEQLTGPSGASEWSVADVLSHLGSGAEIGRYPVVAALTSADVDAPENTEIWDRWNAMAPADQASGFLGSDEELVATYEAMTPEQREQTQIDLGFLPQPVPLATAVGMRLNEVVLHAWDVRAGLDPAATLSDEAASLLAEHYTETMSFLLGFVGQPGDVGPTRVALGDHTVVVEDAVRLEPGTEGATATFEGPFEAGVRLITGRLRPEHTPADVAVTGDVSLEDLRTVFPGY
ncbi:maleylpyruvate isomerase family mycothiol-dependent enzyme [Nocardioides anomalus]|uniref:Maleylpyruvate isomerase family mycothiol-dependent enzyme n=1 Tax=Nocardioides anomalus TaxID=2712223 RepID=A0A6G6WCI0_9ACTN|nr:maleylpyruvate isomerase family mycothiol-dependent enzyme [Nocardioides anomalus]QIG43038.1 maleylpyruvate isomerase family mycothiol-dependent enzyme [Nocardioides anomalus]